MEEIKETAVAAEPSSMDEVYRDHDAPVMTVRKLLEAGVQFGHQTRRWNPKMQEGATVRKAFEEFVEWLGQSGRSRGHVRNVGATGAKFCEAFGDRVPSTVQSDEILTWLLALPVSPKSKKNIRGDISSFFLWCKNAKGWVSVLPELDARLLPRVGKASVDVWTAEEAEAALRKCRISRCAFLRGCGTAKRGACGGNGSTSRSGRFWYPEKSARRGKTG